MLRTALPAKYDLRANGKVSPVKDQGTAGVCWAFATVASLESTLLPGETWDFSENNMKNLLSDLYPEGFTRNFTAGANHKESTAYLVRWTGPVNQSDDPYNATSPYSPANLTVQKHVQRVDYVPDRINSSDNNNIKTAVQTFGAVYTTYNMSDNITLPYWNDTFNSYYYFGDAGLNHAVAIVGWDDGWSRYNFSTIPPIDGAFIIKNSWGSGWGDGGFFYCSYNDTLIGKDNALFLSSPPKNYDHIYQYDPLGWVSSLYTVREKDGWAANVFTSTRSQNLSAVSFYTTDTNANYQVWVYWNPDNGPVLNSSGAVFTQSGTFANAGYHTIAIQNEIPLDANDRFAVAVKLINPTYNYSIAYQDWTYRTTNAKAYPGQGYFSSDGTGWSDITEQAGYKNVSFCIKAFTRDPTVVADFTATPRSGMAPLNVSFSDLSTGSPIAWNWSFGDGIFCTQKNPWHNYIQPGMYTVSLTATNSAGSNTSTRTNYITVSSVKGDNTIIGFRWNTSDPSPRLYQIDSTGAIIPKKDATFWDNWNVTGNMKTVVVNAANSTVVVYGTNNRGDGLDLSGASGDVMVEIPRFYTCSTYANGNFSYWISPLPAPGFTVAPMFNQRGTGTDAGTPAAYYYVGRYDASLVGNKLQSATGKAPGGSMIIGAARTYAENKGAGWGITSIWTLSGLRQLFYTEMLTLDSQTAWAKSRGVVDYSPSNVPKNSGADFIDTQISANNATGSGTGTNGYTPVSYRGIENLWGNVWQFQDGFNAIQGTTNVINSTGLGVTGQKTSFKDLLDANDVQSVGALVLTDGYQKNLMNTDVARPLFQPSAVGGLETTYLSDYYYYPRSKNPGTPNILVSGGAWADAGDAGVGGLSAYCDASYSHAGIGARVEFRRSTTPGAPVASFTGTPTSGTAPLAVRFTDTSTGSPTSWNWSFGDESYSTEMNPHHIYSVKGTYPVTLTATNAGGSNSLTKTGYITVSDSPSNRARLILSDVLHYQNTVTSTPIRVMNLTSGTGISFNLTYDPSVIQVNEITLNESYVSGSSLEVNATPGLIRLALTRTDPITIGSPVPLFFLNTTGTGPVGASTPLNFSHATWSTPAFDSQPMDT
ncbi:MAG: lectin like domain-containing protein, partial [Methanoregula sp.]